jgi:hypothetical protein
MSGNRRPAILNLAFAVFLGASCMPPVLPAAHATTIAGIRTPEQVAIAADSMGTARANRIETNQPACKIFSVNDTGFAVSGLTKAEPGDFDAVKLIAGILGRRNTLSESADDIADRLTSTLVSCLGQLKQANPSLYAKSLEGENGDITSILLAAHEGGRPVAIGMAFRGSEDPGGQIRIAANRVACPGDCPNGVMFFLLGERVPIDRYIAEHGKDRLLPAESGAPLLVRLVIDAGSKRVGPPVDVLVVDRHGVSWTARKEGCGGAPGPMRRPGS